MYCQITDILKTLPKKELVNLTNDENRELSAIDLESDSDPVVVRVNQAITDADSEINSYLQGRYSVPLNPVPNLIKKISCDLAIYHLFTRRFREEIPYSEVYKSRLAQLKLIQSGQMVLDVAQVQSSGIYATNKTSEDRVFTKSLLDQYWQ